MGRDTNIQWCDDTVNPVEGCVGCELFPTPERITAQIDRELIKLKVDGWERGTAWELFEELVDDAWEQMLLAIGEPGPGHINDVTTTNIYHLRERFGERVSTSLGKPVGKQAVEIIVTLIKCYAAKLHFNRAHNLLDPDRKVNRGYAPTFEQVTTFEGRLQQAARWPDLLGQERPNASWMNGLPRLIFISDMGDAFSRRNDFDFLVRELEETQTDNGRRHLWLWLTKRPEEMQKFARRIHSFPQNVCAMTTVTSKKSLSRVEALRQTDAPVRGLSLEPLWTSVADELDLSGIDWVIVGGESGAMEHVTPFPVEWAEEIQALCREQGVAYFLKQLGRRPTRNGDELSLRHSHGGDWEEWDQQLRVREFPNYFHNYRQDEKSQSRSVA